MLKQILSHFNIRYILLNLGTELNKYFFQKTVIFGLTNFLLYFCSLLLKNKLNMIILHNVDGILTISINNEFKHV